MAWELSERTVALKQAAEVALTFASKHQKQARGSVMPLTETVLAKQAQQIADAILRLK